MKTNVFLNEKVKGKGMMAKEFAGKINVSEIYAKKLLAPSSKKLPSEDVMKRIVIALSLSGEEEKTLRRLIEEDRQDLDGGPVPEPDPKPPGENQEILEMKRDIKKLVEDLDENEDWIHGVEEMLWKYREESRAWGEKIEERMGKVEDALEELRKAQETSFKKGWMWFIGLGILGGGVVTVLLLGILFVIIKMFN